MVKKSIVSVSDSILLTSLQFSFGYNLPAPVTPVEQRRKKMEITLPNPVIAGCKSRAIAADKTQTLTITDMTQLDENNSQ